MRVLHFAALSAVVLVAAPTSGCAGASRRRVVMGGGGAFRDPSLRALRAPDDPTVRGSRLLPERLDEGHSWSISPGGGVQAIVAGVRIVSSADGAIVAAIERLPAGPSMAVALPGRMGVGFLFALGKRVWRADSWLGPLVPLFNSPAAIAQVFVGLDRAYVRSPQGTLFAFDPRTGVPASLGPLPASPSVGRLAALDAWHAVAIADLRGALVTRDAGATWRPLAVPFQPSFQPSDVVVLDDGIAVGGTAERAPGGPSQWFQVRPDGQTARLPAAPATDERPLWGIPAALDATPRPLGSLPLAAVIEDGWPLVDGSALLARDGALARVRLSDGAIVERVVDAFPLKPARCHALSLARPADRGSLAFVCGEPSGRTILYEWEAPSFRLVELKHFDGPREVLAFGNGALAARGPCAAASTRASAPGGQTWCTMTPRGEWSETTVQGEDADRARVVVLADGRLAVVHPPSGEDLSTAHVTLLAGASVSEVPISFPTMQADVARALRLGIWMDGFEERRPGILGGWIDAAGSVLGIEIGVDGTARTGEYIRDAGAPIASGRWAFGWTASRRGFETTDGGMTWAKGLDLPDPISSLRGVRERACGPVGCIAAGWLRVGWGSGDAPVPGEPSAPQAPSPARVSPSLTLDCVPVGGPAPELPAPPRKATARARLAGASAGVVAVAGWGTMSELPGFSGRAGPAMTADDLGVTIEATVALERTLHDLPLARVYAWGPGSGDWDPLGRWQVRWQWPWAGWADTRSSATAAVPWTNLDAARRALGIGPAVPTVWTVATGDDADHALLLARHPLGVPTVDVFVLEAGRVPIEIHRPAGEPFPEVEAAVRTAGRWYVATRQGEGEAAATVVWLVDGAVAREVARAPRVGFEARPALRLARRADGRALGMVVDGQGDGPRGSSPVTPLAVRWVAALDLESGAVGDPEPLAPVDLSDRPVGLCAGDDDGWELEVPYPGSVVVRIGSRWTASLQSVLARMKISGERGCIERLLGSVDGYASIPVGALTGAGPDLTRAGWREHVRGVAGRAADASVQLARTRYALRCSER